MIWRGLFVSFVFLSATFALGQQPPGGPPAPATPPRPAGRPAQPAQEQGLQGEQKLRWVCRQLRLSDQQMQEAENLIAVYHEELKQMEAEAADLLQRIRDKYAEIQDARAQNNQERVKQLQEELRAMAPAAQAENHFFEALEPVLNDEQRSRLASVRKRAETAADVNLRPAHVLRAARQAGMTPQQQEKLEAILADYRSATPVGRPESQPAQTARVDKLVADVRALLTPAQQPAYDKLIAEWREDPPKAQPFQPPAGAKPTTMPTTAPAAPSPAGAPGK